MPFLFTVLHFFIFSTKMCEYFYNVEIKLFQNVFYIQDIR